MLPATLLTLLATTTAQEPSATTPPPAPELKLDVRVHALSDLWFEVRSRVEERSRDPLLDPALGAMRELERRLGSPLLFGWVEGYLERADDSAMLLEAFQSLPETQSYRGPAGAVEIPLRDSARKVAEALAEIEATWLEERWTTRREALLERAASLRATFASPEGRAALAHLSSGFELRPAEDAVPVLLVSRTPKPGAFTHRRVGGGGVCYVGLAGLSGSLLDEVVLHEALHALDVLGHPSLLTHLRAALTRRGVGPRDPRQRAWVHTLFFLHAAETVRTHLDPEHRGYGVDRGYYVKVPEVMQALEPLWGSWTRDELERDAFLDAVAEAASAVD